MSGQPLIISDQWLRQICASQGINYERSTRIIIDATAGSPVRMYITQFGDAGLLELTAPEVVEPGVREKRLCGRDATNECGFSDPSTCAVHGVAP